MIFVLSPAKALDYASPLATRRHSQPAYLDDAAELIAGLCRLSHAEVAGLMHLSDPLAALNVARYAEWSLLVGEVDVQPQREAGPAPRQRHRLAGARRVDHQAGGGDHAAVVGLGDAAVDPVAVAEVVGVDDEDPHGGLRGRCPS